VKCEHVHHINKCRVICALCMENGHKSVDCPERCTKRCEPEHLEINCYIKCKLCEEREHISEDCPKRCQRKCRDIHKEKNCKWLDEQTRDFQMNYIRMLTKDVTDIKSYFRFMKRIGNRALYYIGHNEMNYETRIEILKEIFNLEEQCFYMTIKFNITNNLKYKKFYKLCSNKIKLELDDMMERVNNLSGYNYNEIKSHIAYEVDDIIISLIPKVDTLFNLSYNYIKSNLKTIATTQIKTYDQFKTFLGDQPLILETDDEYKWAYVAYAKWPKKVRHEFLETHLDDFLYYFTVESGGNFTTISKLDDYFYQKGQILEANCGKLINGELHITDPILSVKIKARNHR